MPKKLYLEYLREFTVSKAVVGLELLGIEPHSSMKEITKTGCFAILESYLLADRRILYVASSSL